MDIKILQSVQVSDIIVVVIDANYIVLHIRNANSMYLSAVLNFYHFITLENTS